MYREDTISILKPLMASCLEKGGFVLVDLRLYKDSQRRLILEVLADRTEGGITLDECATLNREMGEIIDKTASLPEDYTLEVSSPGLDRPLVTTGDFRRAIGRDIRVFLKEPLQGRLEHRGVVESVQETDIVIKTETTSVHIPLDKLNKAKQVIL